MKITFKQSGFDPQIFYVNIHRLMFSLSVVLTQAGRTTRMESSAFLQPALP